MALLKTTDEWMSIVQECRSSGLSDRQWCENNGIPTSTFYYNIRRLRKMACELPPPAPKKEPHMSHEVVQLRVDDDANSMPVATQSCGTGIVAAVRIDYMGMAVSIQEGTSPETILSVVRAVRMGC